MIGIKFLSGPPLPKFKKPAGPMLLFSPSIPLKSYRFENSGGTRSSQLSAAVRFRGYAPVLRQ